MHDVPITLTSAVRRAS